MHFRNSVRQKLVARFFVQSYDVLLIYYFATITWSENRIFRPAEDARAQPTR